MLNDRAIRWLESRKIDVEMASALGIESCKAPGGGEGIKIPYVVGTEAVNAKFRCIEEKRFSQEKGGTKCFWNFNALADPTLSNEPLVIVEGEMDALPVMQAGFSRVVSVPDGAPEEALADSETRKYGYIDHAKANLREVKEVILATDGDRPGVALMNDLALRIGRAKCKWVRYPPGCKDMGDVLVKFGEDKIREVLQQAQWCRLNDVYRMSDLRPVPERKRYSTGFEFLEPHFKVRPGDFSVVTGVPGHGKSTWVNDLACRLVDIHGWTVAFASPEQHPQTDHKRALRQWYCSKAPKHCSPAELAKADEWIDEHFVFLVPDEDGLATLEWTLDKAAAAVVRYGANMIVIDPWNELDHDRPREMSETEYTGFAIKHLKRLARSLEVHVMVVAHPAKMQQANDKPHLYSISGSSHWANKADVGIRIHRGKNGATTELAVLKSRYQQEIGETGKVEMILNTQTMRYSSAVSAEELDQERLALGG